MLVTELMKQKPAAQTQTAPQEERKAQGAAASTTTATEAAAAEDNPGGLGAFLFALAALLLIVCAAPFLAGLQNVIGIVIIGIGMYEAWKLNRRLPLVITGPHALASSGAAAIVQ
jgi:hypothetical protein